MTPEIPVPIPERLAGATAPDSQLAPDAALTAWQEERRSIIGGTDMAAIAGFSPWRKPWDVAAEKKGLIPPLESSELMDWGLLLEEPIAKEYARRTGHRVRRVNQLVRDKEHPFLGGHPDRLVIGQRRGVEVKTVRGKGAQEWSAPGEPQKVPKHYYVQCMHYLGVMRFETWDLVPLFNMSAMRIYEILANPQVIAILRDKAVAFHQRFIAGDELPPMEPSEAAQAYLKATYPGNTMETFVAANPEQEEWISKWLEAKAKREKAEEEENRWKLKLQAAIGSASGIQGATDVITWKKDRDSMALVTDWEAILREVAEQHHLNVPAELIVRHTTNVVTRQGARKMLHRERK